jgi:hypothetical protein
LSKGSPNAGLGAEGGTLQHAASLFINPFVNSGYWNINPQQMESQSINYGLQQTPNINAQNMQQLQSLLQTALPGYQSQVNQMSRNNAQLIRGDIPTDVQNQIQRFGAQSTITSGIGAGGGAGAAGEGFNLTNKTITARDLGLTSLSLQQTGQTQESNLLQLSKNYLTPQQVNPLSLLPLNQLIGAQQWQDTSNYEASLAAYNAASQFASTQAGVPPQPLGGAGGDISGIIAALTKSYPQGSQSGNTNLLSSLFGGGGGGGGLFGGGGGGGGSSGLPTGSVSGYPAE